MSVKGRFVEGALSTDNESIREDLRYTTVTQLNNGKVALDVVGRKYYLFTAGAVVVGGDTNTIEITGHNLKKGYAIRFVTTANDTGYDEISVLEVVDADTFKLAGVLDLPVMAGDIVDIMKPVSERVAADGSSLATVVSPPIKYYRNGIEEYVSEDTVNFNNSTPLPVKVIEWGGNVNVTTGDVHVHITDMGVKFDAVKIGDGSGTYLGLTALGEVKVSDVGAAPLLGNIEDAIKEVLTTVVSADPDYAPLAKEGTLADVSTNTLNTVSGLVDVETAVNAVDTTLTTTIDTSIGQVSTDVLSLGPKLDALNTYMTTDQEPNLSALVSGMATLNADVAKNAKLEEVRVLLGDEVSVTGMAGDFVDATLHERLSRISHRIHELDNKFNTLGQHNKSNSVSVVLANNSDPIDVAVPSEHFDTQYDATLSAIETVVSVPAGATSFTIYCNSASSEATLLSFVSFVGTMGLVIEQGRMEEFKAPASGSIYIKGQGGASIVCIIWNK